MSNRNEKKTNLRSGFTLIEVIIVVAIIGILASIAAVSIGRYIETTYMMKANQTAKTIFFAVQNQLTEMKAGGELEALNFAVDSQKVDLTGIHPEEVNSNFADEKTDNEDNIRYLLLSKSGTDNQELTAMLKPYIYDPEILDNSILIEYNVKTAVIRSVFYSEKTGTFKYGGGEKDLDSVSYRNGTALKDKKQGYYGVDYTGKLDDGNVTYTAPKVKIVNGDALTVEWSDSYTNIANASYDVSIMGEDGTQYLKVTGIKAGNVDNHSIITANKSSPMPFTAFTTENSTAASIDFRIDYDTGDTSYPFKLILDSLQNSIYTIYPSIAVGNIKAEVTVSGTNLPTKHALSNMEHSYYASEAQISWLEKFLKKLAQSAGFANDLSGRDEPVYGLSNMRHLNNIRYASEKSNFKQLNDIDWAGDYLGEKNTRAFEALEFTYITDFTNTSQVTTEQKYAGCFFGNDKKISNITVNKKNTSNNALDNAGLFAFAGTKAVLSDITLENIKVSGKDNVGSLAGSNEGIIKDCTVAAASGSLSLFGENNIGGIAGYNSENATIKSCQNVLLSSDSNKITEDVLALIKTTNSVPTYLGNFVGGIAGYNNGTIQDATVNNNINGANYVGGIVGQNDVKGTIIKSIGFKKITVPSDKTGVVAYDGYDVSGVVIASGNVVGGIVGENLGDSKSITQFVNSAHVIGTSYVGGIFGINGAFLDETGTIKSSKTGESQSLDCKITQCFNRGFVYGTTSYTGGITGYNIGTITGCENDLIESNFTKDDMTTATCDYVGGIAGYNNGTINGSANRPVFSNNVVKGNNYVGGIVGENSADAVLDYCQTSGGQILANGSFVGGYVGLNRSANAITSAEKTLANEAALIKGKYFVGGIFGANIANKDGAVVIKADNGTPSEKIKTYKVEGEAFVGGIIGGNLAVLPELSDIKPYTDTPVPTAVSQGKLTIKNSANQGSVTATRYVGGIIGYNYSSCDMEIKESSNNGTVTANATTTVFDVNGAGYYYIGGVTGRNSSGGTITSSYNNGDVNSPSLYTGGIVEVNEGIIEKCGNSGTIKTSKDNAGGIAGLNKSFVALKVATIKECTNTGKVVGNNCIGGVVGKNEAVISNCNLNAVTGQNVNLTGATGADNVGGIVGINTGLGTITDCKTTSGVISGISNIGGIVGYNNTTQALLSLTNAASVSGSTNIGGIVGSNDGTTIESCTNSGEILSTAADLGCAGGITSTNALDKEIKNCINVGKVSAVNKNSFAGGIAADNSGTITSCKNGGVVSGYSSTGGIAGINSGIITSGVNNITDYEKKDYTPVISVLSTHIGAYTSTYSDKSEGYYAGGIAGYNKGTLTDCSNKGGTVQGFSVIGGLVGYNTGKLTYTDESITNELKVVEGTVLGTAAANVSNQWQQIGGVVGRNFSADMKTISGFVNKAEVKFKNVSDNSYAGGITAINLKGNTIDTCDNQGTVTGTATGTATSMGTGGIVGKNEDGATVQNITLKKGNVNGVDVVGGIIGLNNGSMKTCVNGNSTDFVTVTGTRNYAGGYIGYDASASTSGVFKYMSEAPLKNYGYISGYSYVGGIVGRTSADMAYCENLNTVYSTGSDSKNTDVGGIAGWLYSTGNIINVENCTNSGTVTAETGTYIGGVIGRAQGTDKFALNITSCVNAENAIVQSTGSAQYIGGVIGLLQTGAKATECKNSGDVTNIADNAGGIFGYINSAQAISCTNLGTVKAANNAGGISGYVSNENNGLITTLDTCNNSGIVSGTASAARRIGGIIGLLESGNNVKDTIIKSCENGKENTDNTTVGYVSGSYDVGGIIGGTTAKQKNTQITSCINYGRLYGSNTSERGGVGGIIGTLSASTSANLVTTVSNCQNYGNIYDVAIHSGGIVGYINSYGIISSCTNYGKLGTDTQSNLNNGYIGGIVGTINANSRITNCTNNGLINIALQTPNTSNTGRIGGIVGSLSNASAIVEYCTNKNALLTNTNNVGGIAGLSTGAVISCKTDIDAAITKSDPDSYHIVGYQNVGGLVGNNSGVSSIIYSGPVQTGYTSSNETKDLDLSYNSMNVSGYQSVGGAVGLNNSGGILTIYNNGKVLAQNPTASAGAGGIAGTTTSSGARGSIANCYNLGKVSQKITNTSALPYIGGIVGVRYANSANIKESYYLDGQIDNASKNLSVGNENVGFLDVQDYPQNDTVRTKPAATALSNIQEIMKKYAYTLNYTVGAQAASVYEYQYKVSWTAVQGFVSGYQVRLYEVMEFDANGKPSGAIGSAIDESDQTKLKFYKSYDTSKDRTINGRLTTSQTITFDATHVGKTYAVAVVTLGMDDINGKHYSYNSNESVSPMILTYRKILPVLPAPVLSATAVDGKKYRITIDSSLYTDNYPNKDPKTDINDKTDNYPSFTSGSKDIYLAYSNGLSAFSGTDYYDSKEKGTAKSSAVPSAKDPFNYKFESLYSLLCDYTNDTTYPPGLPYHFMKLRAISKDTSDDGYATSPVGELSFKVYTKLKCPTDITEVYKGTTIVPKYDVSFTNAANNNGYTVQILDEDGTTVIAEKALDKGNSTGTTVCSILDTDFKDGKTFSDYLNKKLYISIKTLGTGVYIDSDFSPNVEFKVPNKLDKPVISYAVNADDDTKYTISWTKLEDASKYNMRVYLADAGGLKTGDALFTSDNLTDSSAEIILNDEDINKKVDTYFGKKYVIEVDTVGKEGTSLDADMADAPFIVYARLGAPIVDTPILISKEVPKYTITWTDATATAVNCSGYKVYFIPDDASPVITELINGWDTKTFDYTFDEAFHGKTFVIKIVALGKDGISSNSLNSNSQTLASVAKHLAAPTDIAFTDGFDTDKHPVDTYGDMLNKITWTKSTDGDTNVGSYLLKLFADGHEMTDEFGTDGITIATTAEEYSFKIPPKYAGQKLTAAMTTIANSELNSVPADADFGNLAKAILPMPTISTFEHTGTNIYNAPKLVWDTNKFAAGYELTIEYLGADGNAIGTADVKRLKSVNDEDSDVDKFTYTYNADDSRLDTALSYKATVKMLGDEGNKHYVDSVASVSKVLIIPHKLEVTGFDASLSADRAKLHLAWSKTENALKYVVAVSYIGSPTVIVPPFDVDKVETSYDFNIDSTKCSAASSLKVTIKAVGDGIQYLDSDNQPEELSRLDKVENFVVTSPAAVADVDKYKLAWDEKTNASGYEISVSYLGGAVTKVDTVKVNGGSVNAYEYEIDTAVCSDALSLRFSIKANGDNKHLDSEAAENSGEYSISIENVVLAVNNKGTDNCSVDISWNELTSAKKYIVKITEINVDGTKLNYADVEVDGAQSSYSTASILDADKHISSFEVSVYAEENKALADCANIKHTVELRPLAIPIGGAINFGILNLIILILSKIK